MVRDLDLAMEVVPVAIVREADGLAMSSRNVYLTPEHRTAAPVLYRALAEAKSAYDAGERDADRLRFLVAERITAAPHAEIEYVSLADDETLEEIGDRVERPALISVVVRFGRTRLLDNVELG